MKRTCMIIVSAVVLLLSGCRAGDPDGLLSGDSTGAGKITETALATVSYSYANTLKGVPGGSMCDVGDYILFVAQNSGNLTLFTYNKATGEVAYFCQDATCTHDPLNVATDADCAARGISGNLEVANGRVYGEYQVANKDHFDSYSAVLNGERFIQAAGPGATTYRHQGGETYAITIDGVLVRLTSGKPEVICEEFTHSVIMFKDGYCYTIQADCLIRQPLDGGTKQTVVKGAFGAFSCDGSYLYYFDSSYHMYRCALDGSNPVQLTDYAVWPPSINFAGGDIYYARYPEDDKEEEWPVYCMKDGDFTEQKMAALPVRVQAIYAFEGYDRLFLNTSGGIYTLDIATGETAQVILP